jgi:ABC-type glycerol-3-phosphate transport system substrate-binding protein
MYEVVLSAYGWERGWEILTGITRNAISFSATASQVGKDVAQGEVACGMAIDSYAGELLRRYGREHLEFVVPPGLSPVTGDAVAILRGAPHRKAAEQFVEYLLSEEGQTVIFAKLGEPGGPRRFEIGKLTVLPQLYGKVRSAAPINDNPFLWRFSFRYDAQQSGNRWGVINELIGTFLIDHHRAIREFGQLPTGAPVTQQEVDAIVASGQWSKDPLYRRQFANRWMETARNRYATGSGSGLLRSLLPGMIFLVFLAAPLVRGRRSPASIPASFHHPR